MKRVFFSLLLAALGAVFSLGAYALTDAQREAMAERLEPVGSVCTEGDEDCGGMLSAAGGTAAAATAAEPRSGQAVYDAACAACHSTGAGGAPKLGDTGAWADRIAQGMEALYESGIQGVPGTTMMAKGGCANCSDQEIKNAVDYMVEQSQ